MFTLNNQMYQFQKNRVRADDDDEGDPVHGVKERERLRSIKYYKSSRDNSCELTFYPQDGSRQV